MDNSDSDSISSLDEKTYDTGIPPEKDDSEYWCRMFLNITTEFKEYLEIITKNAIENGIIIPQVLDSRFSKIDEYLYKIIKPNKKKVYTENDIVPIPHYRIQIEMENVVWILLNIRKKFNGIFPNLDKITLNNIKFINKYVHYLDFLLERLEQLVCHY